MSFDESLLDYPDMRQALVSLLEMLYVDPQEPGDRIEASRQIMRAAINLFAADFSAILIINPVTGSFVDLRYTFKDPNGVENEIIAAPQIDKFTQDILKKEEVYIADLSRVDDYFAPAIPSLTPTAVAAICLYTRRQRRPMAILYIGYERRYEFGVNQKSMLRLLAKHSSSVLQHAWSMRRYREVALIGQLINQDLSTAEGLFVKLKEHLPNILGANSFFLMAVHDEQRASMSLHMLEGGQTLPVINRSLGKEGEGGACDWVIKNQIPLIIDNYKEQKGSLPIKLLDLAGEDPNFSEAMMFVPLKLRDVTVGVLSVQQNYPYAYDKEDQRILEMLGNHVALALGNLRLFEGLSQLNKAGQSLTRQLDSARVLDEVINLIVDTAKADLVTLFPYSNVKDSFEFPPKTSGTLIDPDFAVPNYSRPDDIATLSLKQTKAVFAPESVELYELVGGDPNKRMGNFEIREQIASTAAVPLLVGEETVGVLFINFRSKQRFSFGQRQMIEGLANYAAIAIKNSRDFDELNQRNLRMVTVLRSIDREISKTLIKSEILDKILKLATQYLLDRKPIALNGSILLYHAPTNQLQVEAAIGQNRDLRLGQKINLNEERGLTYWVFKNRVPVLAHDVYGEEQWRDWYYEVDQTTRSELDVPLLDENEKVIGIISYESPFPGRFDLEDQDFLMTLSNQAVLAIKNAQAYEREKRIADELSAIQAVERQMIGKTNFPKVAALILDKALEITRSSAGQIMLVDTRRKDIYTVAERGVLPKKKRVRLALGQGVVGAAIERGQILNVNVCEPPWKDIYERMIPEVCWELAIPLMEGEQSVGVINIESLIENPFTERDVRLLSELADLTVIALQSSLSYANADVALKRFQLLYEAGQKLAQISEFKEQQLDEAYSIVVEAFSQRSDGQIVVRRYEEETQKLVVKKARKQESAEPFPEMGINEGVNGLAARSKKTIVLDDTKHPPKGVRAKLSDERTRTLVVTPIILGKSYYGNIALSHPEPYFFNSDDVRLVEGLAQQLAITLQRLEVVSARQNAEQRAKEYEVMGLIGQSAYELTHRLAGDLGPIRSWVYNINLELRKQDPLTLVVKENLERILHDVGVVLDFAGRLKQEVAEMEEGRLTHIPEPVPVNVFLDTVKSRFSSLPLGINLVIEPAPGLSLISAVPTQVDSILYNLITNAIEAMPKGGTVTIRTRSTKHSVEIEVEDMGIGIPPEELPKIYSLFYSTKESSGFGLWSARRNTLANGGELKVRSTPGIGTTFTIHLPRAAEPS